MVKVEALSIPDVKLITPAIFRDERGFLSETFNAREMASAGIAETFVQDNHAISFARGVVRGLHFQLPPYDEGELASVVRGAIFDVAVDIRHGSPTFGMHVACILSANNRSQLWYLEALPTATPRWSAITEAIYKVTSYYAPAHDRGLRWDDPDLAIAWAVALGEAALSAKDR